MIAREGGGCKSNRMEESGSQAVSPAFPPLCSTGHTREAIGPTSNSSSSSHSRDFPEASKEARNHLSRTPSPLSGRCLFAHPECTVSLALPFGPRLAVCTVCIALRKKGQQE